MKSIAKIAFVVMLGVLLGCGEKEKPLYDQVMDIHDEVMPKMEDLHRAKKLLKDSVAKTPEMPIERKTEIEQTILLLDSAQDSMMEWMRGFVPPEPTDKEAYEKYMEAELVKVRKMRETVLSALQKIKK